MLRDSIVGLWQILRAMGVTLKYFFTKPVTVQYPKEPVRLYPRFRGRHELLRYEDGPYKGLERCIGCALCAAYCPTQCIYVKAGENTGGAGENTGGAAENAGEAAENAVKAGENTGEAGENADAGSAGRPQNPPEAIQRSPGERYAEIYEINLLRCMFCGYCEEACPTGAIVLRREFALADYSRESLIYTQDRLLEPAEPNAIILDDLGDAEGE